MYWDYLSYQEKIPLKAVKILTDDVEVKPFLDFDRYTETIVSMIKGSEPNFSIGIYGEWGSGKTTLMRSIEKQLGSRDDILTIWFNAWRYEREEQFALVSLMKTIAYKMDEQPKYDKAKQVLFKSIITVSKGLLSKYVFSDKYVDELQTNLDSNMKTLAQVDKDTIYFQGLKQIEDTMNNVLNNSPNSRIVVFVDDLDRCSPQKALEVFESIKAFLGIIGFIYVIGLSYETIAKLITAQYEKSGITGEKYIKKIIQIPILVPEWSSSDIGDLVEEVILDKLDQRYSKIIKDNKDLIALASEANPREVKRFINNFIVSNEIFSVNTEVQPRHLLAVQALKVRWSNFYRDITSDNPELRTQVEKYATMMPSVRINSIRELKSRQEDKNNVNQELEKKIIEIDQDLWKFLNREKDVIFKINNWEIYRRAAESTKPDLTENVLSYSELTRLSESISQELKVLLDAGKVMEFNKLREENKTLDINILNTYIITNLDLSGIDLSGIKFRNATFLGVNLSGANLRKTKLFQATLKRVNFTNADLSEADLTGAVLDESIFHNTILQQTDITSVKFLPIRISEAKGRGARYDHPPLYSKE